MNILIGITGGIAAYKIPELVRKFIKNGDNVKLIQTESAQSFVTPFVLEALSKNTVYTDFSVEDGFIEHIELAKWADIFIIAPASANTISDLANGRASSVLLATALAYKGFMAIFPSMNVNMLEHPATQKNIRTIKEIGYHVYESDEGSLACGVSGKGRLPQVNFIFDAVYSDYIRQSTRSKLKGMNFVLSMGYTKAFIDPVRFVSNGSSGQMGFALAKTLYEQGANIKVIVNKEVLDKYPILDYFADDIATVETTKEALEIAKKFFKDTAFYISAAAFSDFDSMDIKDKLKPKNNKFNLEFKKAPDILENLGKLKTDQITVGFALESSKLEEYARTKLERKNLDMIIANDVNTIGSDSTSIMIIHRSGRTVQYAKMSKTELAKIIVSEIERAYVREV